MKQVVIYEKIFLGIGAALLGTCLLALLYATAAMGILLPGDAGQLDPQAVHSTPPFDKPGLREIAPGKYEAVVVARTFFFLPSELTVPADSEVTFVATSGDVIHGFHIEKTRLNLMLIPGQVSRNSYRFTEPGEYRVVCHEYCGAGHHTMAAKIVVTEKKGEAE